MPDLTWGTTPEVQTRTAAQLTELGSKWVRLTINWKDAEKLPRTTDEWWRRHHEEGLAKARAAGQKVLVVLYTTPTWASGRLEENAQPLDYAEYARFVQSVATRFGDSIDAYEVWNEPNFQRFWPTGPNAAEYTRLLKAAYPALKAADPSAPVLFAGPSTNDYEFLEQAYRSGAKGSFDVMGAHPYSCGKAPDVVERDANGRIRRDSFLGYRELRKTMEQNGDPKPIWITEFGWSTTSQQCGVTEADQARYVQTAYELLCQDPYVEVALYYNLRNNYFLNDDPNDIEANYGLSRSDFAPKPAYAAWKAAAANGCAAPARLTLALKRSRRRFKATGTLAGQRDGRVQLTLSKRRRGRWVPVRRARATLSGGSFQRFIGRVSRGSWRLEGRLEGAPGVSVSKRRRIRR